MVHPTIQTEEELRNILKEMYKQIDLHIDGSMVYFVAQNNVWIEGEIMVFKTIGNKSNPAILFFMRWV